MTIRERSRAGSPVWELPWTALALFIMGLAAGCSEDDNPLAFDRGPRGPYSIRPETLAVAAPAADLEYRPEVSTAVGQSLFVGRDSLAEASAFVRFESIPDTTTIRRAYLRLFLKPGRGDPITVAVQEVLGGKGSWNAVGIRWANAPTNLGEVLDRVEDCPTETVDPDTPFQLSDLEIPIALVRRWAALPDSNGGLRIFSEEGDGIARFVSSNDAITNTSGARIVAPALILATDSTLAQVRIGSAAADAFVMRDLRAPPGGSDPTAALQSAPAARVLMRFDLADLPPEASIIRATLGLRVPTGQFSAEDPLILSVYEIESDWSEAAPPESVTVGSRIEVEELDDEASDTVELEVGVAVQSWVDRSLENRGILVRMGDEISVMRSLELSMREAPDSSDRPTLRIVFVRTPGYRW